MQKMAEILKNAPRPRNRPETGSQLSRINNLNLQPFADDFGVA